MDIINDLSGIALYGIICMGMLGVYAGIVHLAMKYSR